MLERELGRTKTKPAGGTIIAKEGTIKKWLGLVPVLQLDICHIDSLFNPKNILRDYITDNHINDPHLSVRVFT